MIMKLPIASLVLILLHISMICLNLVCLGDQQINQMRVLSLFSGTKNDLGIDHRLGRQVLKLAQLRAKQLYPNINVDLIVHNDDTDCTSLNVIPNKVVEQFYFSKQQRSQCNFKQEQLCDTIQNTEAQNIQDLYAANTTTLVKETNIDWTPSVDVIIGPSCDLLVDLVARMAGYWQTPIYSVTSMSASFARKDIYTTLTRLSPSVDHLAMFIFKTLERFKWRHVAFIVDTDLIEMDIMTRNLDQIINKMRFLWSVERKIIPIKEKTASISKKLSEVDVNKETFTNESDRKLNLCSLELRNILLNAKKVARVFLLLLNNPTQIRKLLLCAHELGMNNGEFVFLGLNLSIRSSEAQLTDVGKKNQTEFPETDIPKNDEQYQNNQNQSVASARAGSQSQGWLDWYSVEDESNNLFVRQMFESLLVFSAELPTSDEYNLFVEQTLDMVHQEYPEVRFERSSVSSVAAALHDSLLLAVEAQQKFNNIKNTTSTSSFIDEDQDERLGIRRMIRKVPLMWNERFVNGLIPNMHINANGDQELDYVLSDMEPEMGLMRPVAIYSKENRQIELYPGTFIHWPTRKAWTKGSSSISNQADSPPPDEPECGFNDDAELCVDRQNLYAVLLIVVILVILAAIFITFSHYQYKRIKYQQELDDYCWKINWDDIQFIQLTDSLASSSPGSVARALRAGASVISAGTSEVGSIVSISMRKRRISYLPDSTAKQTLDSDAGSKSGSKVTGKFGIKSKKTPSVIVTTTTTTTPGSNEDLANQEATSQAAQGDKSDNNSQLTGKMEPGSVTDFCNAASPGSCFIRSEYSSIVRRSMFAMYNNELIIVKQLNGKSLNITRELLVELRSMRENLHDNLAKFIGLCIEPRRLSIMYEFCSRGSLQDMLLNPSIAMDWTLKYSIIGDIVNGLNFIHTTLLDFHGRLKSTNLVLDSRFTVKITDFGLQNLYSQLDPIDFNNIDDDDGDYNELNDDDNDHQTGNKDSSGRQGRKKADQLSLAVSQTAYQMDSVSMRGENVYKGSRGDYNTRKVSSDKNKSLRKMDMKNSSSSRYFWTAPEHLRDKNVHFVGSKKGDVYSLAIILFEIFTRKEPYYYGTTAKPHWVSIKKDRLAPSTMRSATREQKLSCKPSTGSEVSNSTSFVTGANVRNRANSKIKQAQATVHPTQETLGHNQDDTASMISGQSVATSQHSNMAPDELRRQVRMSVIAIEEEEEEKAKEVFGKSNNPKSEISTTIKTSAENQKIDAEEILDQLRMGIQPEPVRPYVPNYVLHDVNSGMIQLMQSCWNETASSRPTVSSLRNSLKKITKGMATKNYLDNLLERLQNYAADLERIVDNKSGDIIEEKLRTEELLYQLVPRFVADKLKRNEPIIPQVISNVTIFFSDIVNFEKYSSIMSPTDLVDLLNCIYSSFESIINSFDVTKIETIIDQFLIASGISFQHDQQQQQQPIEKTTGNRKNINEGIDVSIHDRNSAENIARMALCIRDLVKTFNFRQLSPATNNKQTPNQQQFVASSFNIRIGIHSGKVCAGIVGLKRPKFCLIGDTVNIASRMMSTNKANKIQITNETRELLEGLPGFSIESRGAIQVKGKGTMTTYWLESEGF